MKVGISMRDILGRKLKIGDLVFYDSNYYLVTGKNEVFFNQICECSGIVYLIDRPLREESAYLQQLTLKYQKYIFEVEEENRRKKEILRKQQNIKKSVASSIVRGDIVYSSTLYSYYCYLGLVSFVDTDNKIYKGYGYVKVCNYNTDSITISDLDLLDQESVDKFVYVRQDDYWSDKNELSFNPFKNEVIKIFKNKSNAFDKCIGHINLKGDILNLKYDYYYSESTKIISSKFIYESTYFPVYLL